jgi:outer membrane lipoprotein-sorting protein
MVPRPIPVALLMGSTGEVPVMVRRHAILGLVSLLLAAGCNAGTSGGLKRQEPPLSKEAISKGKIIAQINKNSATIHSLIATPSMVVEGDGQSVRLDGRLAMERPRDFRFEVKYHMRSQADIGSNDQGFWFWVKDDKTKAPLYVCDYEHASANPLGVTMQPDWIMEAMGLREIPEREAATINATKGDKPGQLVLTQLRTDPKGGTLTKVTVVDEVTGEIREHRLYSGTKEKLLARATIAQTQHIQMQATEADPEGSVVNFPAKLKLEWVVEKFSLDITMGQPTINPDFPKKQRVALFTEPSIPGAVKTDLAKLGQPAASASSSSWIHETAPRSGGIRLGNPEAEPFGNEGASLKTTPNDPALPAADLTNLPPLPTVGYVGPQLPKGPDEAVQTSGGPGWSRATFR